MSDKTVDKRISRTELAFKKALIDLCNQKDFASISISELVENSGYSRSAFYSRFESKDLFIKKLVDDEVEIYVKLSIESITKKGRVSEKTILALFQHVYQNKDLYTLIFGTSRVQQSVYVLTEEYFAEKAFEQIKARDIVKKLREDANAELYNWITLNQFFSLIKFWIKHDFMYTPEYMAKQLLMSMDRRIFIMDYEKATRKNKQPKPTE